MTRANWIIAIFLTALLAALMVWGMVTMSDALLGMVFVLPTIRIKYCTECKWYTNHCQLKSGDWQCWCARVEPVIVDGVSTPEWFAQQKAEPF